MIIIVIDMMRSAIVVLLLPTIVVKCAILFDDYIFMQQQSCVKKELDCNRGRHLEFNEIVNITRHRQLSAVNSKDTCTEVKMQQPICQQNVAKDFSRGNYFLDIIFYPIGICYCIWNHHHREINNMT
jgi:hypothetical protein